MIDVDWEGGEERSDVEEMREVFSAISEFLDKLPELVKKVLDALYSKDLGERVGDSVATFYGKLRESGMPEDMVNRMTMEFFERSMIVDRLVREVVGSIRKEVSEEEGDGEEEE